MSDFLKRLVTLAKPVLLELILKIIQDVSSVPGAMQSPPELRQHVSDKLDEVLKV